MPGEACFVLYSESSSGSNVCRRNGEMILIHGSHLSCNSTGLEGSTKPSCYYYRLCFCSCTS